MPIILCDIFAGNYPITQPFGANHDYYYRMFRMAGHNGVDFGCPMETEIWSATDGVVLRAGDYSRTGWNGFGIMVEVYDDRQHCATLYGHLHRILVKVGQRVTQRQPIGRSNNTGASTGPHLHFGCLLTNAQGVRIKTNNGYGGWVDPDASPFRWEIKY